MATASPRNLLHAPGRLVKDPTDLTAAFPYGGTPLGLTHKQAFSTGDRMHKIRAEEFGAAVEGIYWTEGATFAAFLRSWDPDALVAIFPGAAAGGSGHAVLSHSTTQALRPGSKMSGRTHTLLFAPLSPGTCPAILIYEALPTPDEAAQMQLSAADEIGVAVRWDALPDASGRAFSIGLLEDLEL